MSPRDIIGFAANRTSYEVGVASTVTTATVGATPTHSGANAAITPADAAGIPDGHQVDLNAGANAVTITVTAEDGSTTKTYTININRGVTNAYGWKAEDDLDGLVAGGTLPRNLWTNGTTIWVVNGSTSEPELHAYNMDGTRDSASDFETLEGATNYAPEGIWSDGTTMWVADASDDQIYAYTVSTKAQDLTKKFETLNTLNSQPRGIWADNTTMWVVDSQEDKIFAYSLSTKLRDISKEFDTLNAAGNNNPAGIWSDGETMWVADLIDQKLYAYNMGTKNRDQAKEFNTPGAAGQSRTFGITSNGTTMWASDSIETKAYAYNIPVKTDATLSALTVSPKNIIGFVPSRTEYDVGFAGTVTQATIMATANNGGATIGFSTTDAGPADGHQVNLSFGLNTVTITVTAADTVTTQDYVLYIGRGVTSAYGWKAEDDLNGLVAAGNQDPRGIWGNSTTIWVADSTDEHVYAYNRDGSRDSSEEFDLHSENSNAEGAWSNGTTVWIVDSDDDKVYAYRVSNSVRQTSLEIDLHTDQTNPKGVWSNGTTVWVADSTDDKLYAYRLSNGVRQPTNDISLTSDNTDAHGLWSDGVTMWVTDSTYANKKIYAYNLDDGSRIPAQDFNTPGAAGSSILTDLWSNGDIMWMGEVLIDKIYSFNMPIRNATGAPTISGTAQVGQELAAATTGIRDSDGLTNPGYTYQWIRVDSDGTSNPAIITGATSITYRLTTAEQGKKVKVRVNFRDNNNNDESLTSAAYPASGTVLAAPITDETRGYREPAVFHLITGIIVTGSGGSTGYWIADIDSSINNGNFKIGNTSHTVQQIYTRSNGELVFKSNKGIPEGLDFSLWNRWGTGGWTFSTTDAVAADNRKDLRWPNSGVSFQRKVAVELSSYRRASVNPPTLRSVTVPAGTNTALDVTWDRPTDLLQSYPGPENAWLQGWRSTKNLKGYVVWAYHQTSPTTKRTWKEFVGPSTTRARLTRLNANSDIHVQVCLLFGNEAEPAQRYDGPPYDGPCSETVTQRTTTTLEAQAPPALESQTVPANGQSVQLRFDNPIYRDLLPGTDAFTVTVDGAPLDISSLAASSDSRTLTLAVTPTIRSGRTVRVSYVTPTTGNVLEGIDGVNVEDFTVGATNSSTVTAADEGVGPAPVSARVSADGLTVVLSFDEALFTGQPVPERLTITVNGVATQPGFIVGGDTSSQIEFYLEDNNRFRQGQTVTISYTDPPGNQVASVIQDPDGNDAPPFTNFPVENLSAQLSQSADPPPEPLTVEFQNLPVSHDGTAFTFTLAFSEEFPVEAATVRAALDVTGGAITTAVQTSPPNNRNWQITVQPSAPDTAVTLFLVPKDGCTDEGAICTEDDRGLANGIGTFINAVPPLTAEFLGLPESHGGGKFTFELRFSEDVTVGYRDLRDSIFVVSNGQVTRAKRIVQGETQRWNITVDPSGSKDATILLPVITSCASGVICTEDDRPLSEPVLATVPHTAETPAQEQNSQATGQPSISGTAQVGQELTTGTSGITDSDGTINVIFTYHWIRVDGTNETDISGASGSSYMLAEADQGKTIKVRVSFTDEAGNPETVTSAATATVEATVPGTPSSVEANPAGTGEIEVSWEQPDSNGGSAITGYTVHWKETGDSWENAEDVSEADTRDTSYTITSLSLGTEYTVRVTATNSVGDGPTSAEEKATADAHTSGQQERAENTPATGDPTIGGTLEVGQTLTASTSGISDADGLANATFSYQWARNDGTADTDIQDATGSTYALVSADEGKTVRVRVSFTDDASNEESLTSEATTAVAARPNTPATGAPSITGTAQVAETLTADTLGIADADGLTNATYSYQWMADDANIQGTTGSTYAPVSADVGKTIKVKVSFTDDAGNEESLTSEATPEVAAKPNSPATGQPTITGTAQVGETLTADTSGIADKDGLDNASFGYQWLADDSDIPGATDSAYTLADADVGRTIKVRVSFTDDRGHEESLTSAATNPVAGLRPEPLTARFENQPSSHDGENVFTFELRFSEQFHLSYKTLRDHAFTVTGGTVKKAKRMEQGSNIHWRITVRPDSNSEVSIVLPVTTDCDGQGAICTEDGRALSNRNELTVSGPGG